MTTTKYEGKHNVFRSKMQSTDNKIYLESEPGQELILIGRMQNDDPDQLLIGGNDTSIQYNDNGLLSGNSEFTYNYSDKELNVDNINTNVIKSMIPIELLGHSDIYRGEIDNPPQTLNTAFTTMFRKFGTDVDIARDANYATFACPYYIYGSSKGGVSVWNESGGVFSEYSTYIWYRNFTDEASVEYTAINEDGTILGLSDGNNQTGIINTYTRTGSAWSTGVNNFTSHGKKLRVSSGYMLVTDYDEQFSIYLWNGSAWVLQQMLYDANNDDDVSLSIYGGDKAAFYADGNVKVYTRSSTTWTIALDTAISGVIDLEINGELLIITTNTSVLIYENLILVQTISSINNRYCCTNGTLIFVNNTSGQIRCYKKTTAWIQSGGEYTSLGCKKMACNSDYLAVGYPDVGLYGAGKMFKIIPYAGGGTGSNIIDLDSADSLIIDPHTKVTVTKDLEVVGELFAESIAIGDINTGFRSVAGDITAKCNSVDMFSISPTVITSTVPISVPTGSVTAPSYTFTGDANTGIYRIGADNLGITCNGVKQLDISTARTTVANQFMAPLGSATVPGYSIGSSNTGMYAFGSSIGFATSSTAQMTIDGTHIVAIPPFRQLGNGSVSSPSFSWTNSTNSGMYYTTNAVNFAISGTKNFQINPGGNVNLNSIIGLTTPSTTLGMGAAIEFGLAGLYKIRMGPTGAFLTSVSIGDSGCPLSSLNGSGSNLRITTNGSGKAAIETVNTGGATEFQLFIVGTSGVGSITTNGSTTSYNTTSDYRLKENVTPLVNQLDRIDLLVPVKYDWKNSLNTGEGFLAHELAEVFPEAVHGEKDAVDSEGKIVPQCVDTSFLIGSLVACIKELKEEIRLIKEELSTFV